MKIKEYQNVLKNDWTFIFEALNKLAESTCCDQEEGKICTWDLLPRINEALQEHIDLEAKWLFPHLSDEDNKNHQLEHKRLQELLAKASWELECGYGDQFKTIAGQLLHALKQHDTREFPLDGKECMEDDNYLKIADRIVSPWSA